MRPVALLAISAAVASAGIAAWLMTRNPSPSGVYTPPEGVTVSFFAAMDGGVHQPLVISATSEVSIMVPYIRAFQLTRPDLPVAYLQSLNAPLLKRALQACRAGERTADVYLSSSVDHLVWLSNEGCALKLGSNVTEAAAIGAQWRSEVIAFTAEPAVFVYRLRTFMGKPVPRDHVELIDWLRASGENGRVGVYDIEHSGSGYNYAAEDARQPAIYGRMLESFGRVGARTYCCSLAMIDAVDRGELDFAYNVQMSPAYAAQRAGSRIGVLLPTDYLAVQTRSVMIPRGARDTASAREFVRFLVSPEGRSLSRQHLMEPNIPEAQAGARADALLAQTIVSPLLLKLQDQALRERMIREWRQAFPLDRYVQPDKAAAAR